MIRFKFNKMYKFSNNIYFFLPFSVRGCERKSVKRLFFTLFIYFFPLPNDVTRRTTHSEIFFMCFKKKGAPATRVKKLFSERSFERKIKLKEFLTQFSTWINYFLLSFVWRIACKFLLRERKKRGIYWEKFQFSRGVKASFFSWVLCIAKIETRKGD